jgi:tetratricopeptide (TPR) repeat protein
MRSSAIVLAMLLLVLGIVVLTPVAAAPGDAAGLSAAARTLTEQKNYTEALQVYDQAITLDPASAEAWDGRADVLNRVHQYTADPLATLNLALNASDRALALNASSANAWINHGLILYNIGYYYQDQLQDKATADTYYTRQLDAFSKAISLEPDNADAWFNKAYALCGMGWCNEGVAAFEKVKALNPDYPYLEGNLQNAEKLAETQTPFYIKYAAEIVMGIIVIIGAVLWFVAVRKKY